MTFFWFGTALLGLFWGGSYLAIRFIIETVPPASGALMRILLGCLFVFVTLKKGSLRRYAWRWRIEAMIAGFVMMGIGWTVLFWAERTVLPSLAALMVASMPIFTLILSPVFNPQEKHHASQWVGVGTGFLGVFFLVLPSWQSPDRSQISGSIALLIVALCYAVATLLIRRLSFRLPIRVNIFYQTLGATLALLPITLIREDFLPWTWPFKAWMSLLYLAFFSTFLAWLLFFEIVKRYGSVHAAVVSYFPPLVSLTLDRFVLGELPHFLSITGGLIILCGVYLTQKFSQATPLIRPPQTE